MPRNPPPEPKRQGTPAALEITPERRYLGTALLQVRAKLGWSQRHLGDAMGVSQCYVSQWETGARDIPASYLLRLRPYGVRPEELFIFAEEEERLVLEAAALRAPPLSSLRPTPPPPPARPAPAPTPPAARPRGKGAA
jgi:transcriptional regulator with XRE-family HTH domain